MSCSLSRSIRSVTHSLPGTSRMAPRPTAISRFPPRQTLPLLAPLQSRSAYNFANLGFSRLWGGNKDSESTSTLTTTKKSESSDSPASSSSSSSSSSTTTTITNTESESSGSLFDEMGKQVELKRMKKEHEHRYKSAFHKISHRKLNMLSRQISGLPIDEAIVQMEFSEKRASGWIKSTLALARDHAQDKGLRRGRLIVAETWVSKGPKHVRVDIKGRGRAGIKHHPSARIHVVLREGKTWAEKQEAERRKTLRKVRSAGIVREDGKLRRKVVSGWTW